MLEVILFICDANRFLGYVLVYFRPKAINRVNNLILYLQSKSGLFLDGVLFPSTRKIEQLLVVVIEENCDLDSTV